MSKPVREIHASPYIQAKLAQKSLRTITKTARPLAKALEEKNMMGQGGEYNAHNPSSSKRAFNSLRPVGEAAYNSVRSASVLKPVNPKLGTFGLDASEALLGERPQGKKHFKEGRHI